jgi:hypothetical protein
MGAFTALEKESMALVVEFPWTLLVLVHRSWSLGDLTLLHKLRVR